MGVQAFGAEGGEAEKEEAGVIEGLMGGDAEVVLPAGRMDGSTGGHGAAVGHEAEDDGGLLAIEGDGVAVGVEGKVGGGVLAGGFAVVVLRCGGRIVGGGEGEAGGVGGGGIGVGRR